MRMHMMILVGLLSAVAHAGDRFNYPETKKLDIVEELHGVRVADPYRWLEDLDSEETAAWVAAQNEVTFGYLHSLPKREAIIKRLTKLWNYERYSTPREDGGKYFFQRNDGLQNQSVLYVADTLESEPRELLNPNKLSADGTIALSTWSVSDDGKYLAYGLSDGGSDWMEFKVRDVASGRDLSDHLKWIKFSGAAWDHASEGFYYSRYDAPTDDKLADVNKFQKVYYHKVGTDQSEDVLVYERKDQPEWGYSAFVTDDGAYLMLSIRQGTERKNRIYYKDLSKPGSNFVKLLDKFDAQYGLIDNDGPVFYFYTDLDAPRGRVVAIDIREPAVEDWREIIPEQAETLQGVGFVNRMFVCSYLKDAYSQIKIYDEGGAHVRDVNLPGIGSAGGFSGDIDDTETFYSFTSFAAPPTIYRYDMQTGKSTVFKRPDVPFNPDNYVVRQVFYNSLDGTKIPMFIAHKRGVKLDGTNPTYLYGYGGFNISLSPWFSPANLVWMEMGGVYALANIRGGGEYGKAWHNAGRLKNKQNCFDDFCAAAKYLVRKNYTSHDKLAIGGGSNGGLLVGACITQRPDLFGAALADVGVLDMLRFHKFTIGWAWVSDYGSPDDPDMFRVLHAYSPLHNVRVNTVYPSTMIVTGDHDDRVVPSHSFKFAATLQEAHAGDNPVLIRIETRAGHGAGKPTTKRIEEAADKWAFLFAELGATPNLK